MNKDCIQEREEYIIQVNQDGTKITVRELQLEILDIMDEIHRVCVKNNIDVKSLSEMLGHSSVSITLELYVHSNLEFKKNQINKLKKPSFIAEL